MISIDKGTMVKLRADFPHAAGQAANPTAVSLEVARPDGVSDTPTASSSETGVWTADYATVSKPAGVYRFIYTGTGAVEAVMHDFFEVLDPEG